MTGFSRVSARAEPAGRSSLTANFALTVPFLLLFVVQLVHHQMWRDELNAFGLARASPNLPTLFHYIHYEGHPWLWYVLLWLVSRITLHVAGMKVLEGCIGIAIYLVLGLASPFRWWEKLLLFSGYFVVFEYTVMSRMYGLQLLLALVYVAVRAQRPQASRTCATLLGLMACCDLSGAVLSFALALEYVRSQRPELRRVAGAAAIYAGFVLSALLSLWPAADISRITTVHTFHYLDDWNRLGASLVNYLATPYLATVTGKPGIFWDASMDVSPAWFGAMVALVLAAYWFTFRRRPAVLLMLATTCVLMITVGFVVYRGSVRHFGTTFVAFVCGLWLLRAAGQKIAWPAYMLLALTTAAGIHATIGSWQRPFSQAAATATWMRKHHLEDSFLAGVPTATTIGVAEQLERPLYLIECGNQNAPAATGSAGPRASFFLFTNTCEHYKPTMLPDHLRTATEQGGGTPVTLIDEDPLTPAELAAIQQQGLKITQLASFTGAEAAREDFYLYSVERPR